MNVTITNQKQSLVSYAIFFIRLMIYNIFSFFLEMSYIIAIPFGWCRAYWLERGWYVRGTPNLEVTHM